jgi:hypothetical protein
LLSLNIIVKLAPALTPILTAAHQAAAQYYIDYYIASTTGCVGNCRGCDDIASGVYCRLNDWTMFYDDARIGTYNPEGFTVWIETDSGGTTCGRCRTTSAFGCWQHLNLSRSLGLPWLCFRLTWIPSPVPSLVCQSFPSQKLKAHCKKRASPEA